VWLVGDVGGEVARPVRGGRPGRSGRDGADVGWWPGHGPGTHAEAEAEQLKLALAEAHVQLRVWQKGADYASRVPSKTSR